MVLIIVGFFGGPGVTVPWMVAAWHSRPMVAVGRVALAAAALMAFPSFASFPVDILDRPQGQSTVALRVLVGRSLDLRRSAGIGSDLGVCLPLLSVGDPGLPIVRGPSAAQARHEEGTAGEHDVARSLPAMIPSSGDG